MARTPGANVIAASHTVELSSRHGRRVRGLIDEHGEKLGIALSAESQAAGRWALASGGEYFAAGVGTGIAGFRCDLAVVDDPIRSREDADSKLVRDRAFDWYTSDLLTRLKPGGRVILVMTRWHEDDLAGRILAGSAAGRDQWTVVSVPAQAEENDPVGREPGEFLWDDDPAYPYGAELRRQKAIQPVRNWSALYQQRPAPEEGDYFSAAWLRPYAEAPPRERVRIYGASDYAVTSQGGDYTVHMLVGLDVNEDLWLLDLWRGQTTPDTWVEKWCDMVQRWRPLAWAEETGQIAASVGPLRDRVARERGVYCALRRFPTKGDKATRAQAIRGRIAMRGLRVPEHAPWYAAFRAELLSFPAGTFDDQVDALGLVGVSLPGGGTVQQFISADSVWNCMDARKEFEVTIYDPLVLAVCVARFRGEPTVFCLRRGRDARTVPTAKVYDLDSMGIAARIGEINDRWHPETIFVDAGGARRGCHRPM